MLIMIKQKAPAHHPENIEYEAGKTGSIQSCFTRVETATHFTGLGRQVTDVYQASLFGSNSTREPVFTSGEFMLKTLGICWAMVS